MLNYTIRRIAFAVPTLLVISFAIFLIVTLSPADPTANLPLTIPPEVRDKIRASLGLGEALPVRFWLWLKQFVVIEPMHYSNKWFGTEFEVGQRILSWQTRSPVMDLIAQRIPQTLWVVGIAYIVGILIAVPIGIVSAYRQYSWFDQIGTFVSMIGFSVPTFFTGVLLIVVFSVWLGWFPSIYDTTLVVDDWDSFLQQLKQMVMPVTVLALFNAAQISRFMRASMLDNLQQDYVRTARAKGLQERTVVLLHVLRNSMIPVITVIALNIPTVFGGALITEQVFKVNGLGQLLIVAIQGADVPTVQTISVIFAVLIVLFNLVADIAYAFLDPRIRYD